MRSMAYNPATAVDKASSGLSVRLHALVRRRLSNKSVCLIQMYILNQLNPCFHVAIWKKEFFHLVFELKSIC